MKKSLLLPLCLSLALVGCSRTSTSSSKVASADQTDPNKPTYNDQAITAKKNAVDQSQVAATPTPAPMPSKDITAAATQAPAATESSTAATASAPSIAATPTPSLPDSSSASATPTTPAPAATPELASNNTPKTDLSARLTEWKLNPDDIRSEVAAGGEVVREKTVGAGEPTGPMDGLIISQVSGKLKEESTTSALVIDVSADKGVVTLKGSATSLDQIGKAIALALDTPGVVKTVSQIKLEGTP